MEATTNRSRNTYWKYRGLKITLLAVLLVLLASSCGKRIFLDANCSFSEEKLFKGQKWKLRTLTTLYRPYSEYKPYVRESITAFRIEYPSYVNEEEIVLSGTLIIPHNNKEPLPIMIYCHGTLFNKNYAPSRWNSAIQIEAMPAMAGYIMFIPDYLGYGSSRELIPAYFDQDLTTRTVFDILPTGLKYLDDCGVRYKNELFILGYSQGGHAAVSLLKMIESESLTGHDLELKATVAIAAPYKLKKNVDFILEKDSFPSTAYVSYVFMALNHRHWSRDMSDFFRDSSLYYINEHLHGNVSLNKMAIEQSDYISELVQEKFLSDYLGNKEAELKSSLKANSDFDFIPRTPLLVIHSKADEVVPHQTSFETWQHWIEKGANEKTVLFHSLENANHSESAFEGITIGLDFLDGFRQDSR